MAYDAELTPVVRIRGLTRIFSGRNVLESVNLDIARGDSVALLGHSGSGKSTLMRAAARLDSGVGASGSVGVPDQRAVVFQHARLLPWAQWLDKVILGLPYRVAAAALGCNALAAVALSSKDKAWPGTLSGGETQRTDLTCALAWEPALLLDEPFEARAPLTRTKMHRLLPSWVSGSTTTKRCAHSLPRPDRCRSHPTSRLCRSAT
ncbi:ATP-binding cassette domain-containing protein [Streptomyces sp. NPDC005151]